MIWGVWIGLMVGLFLLLLYRHSFLWFFRREEG